MTTVSSKNTKITTIISYFFGSRDQVAG
ncbi:MAG: hypothetical protein MRQ08_06280 [Candidatus Midichloria mitochondrii]|nr:hypothetical protein [Rickettsia tamurae]MDJ1288797.1 hypothetical protein [Candidatus Midichloria mitochondrii]